jgi:transcriptional regulator GlxA family with amidase domain
LAASESSVVRGETYPASTPTASTSEETKSVFLRDTYTGRAIVDILILPGFELHDLSVLLDTFHLANKLTQREEIVVQVVGLTAAEVPSSIGVSVRPTYAMLERSAVANVVILAGQDATVSETERLHQWIRGHLYRSMTISGIGGGCRVLAESRALRGKMAVAHWELCTALRELYRETQFLDCLLVTDGRITTCGGRCTTLDFSLLCIDQLCGNDIARRIADKFNRDQFRPLNKRQTDSAEAGPRRLPPSLRRALEIINNNIEEPISSTDLALMSEICARQLQRLFVRHFGMTPGRFYQNHRLKCARQLIARTPLSVTEIALATGFKTASHFSKSYRLLFGVRPSMDERSPRKKASKLGAEAGW